MTRVGTCLSLLFFVACAAPASVGVDAFAVDATVPDELDASVADSVTDSAEAIAGTDAQVEATVDVAGDSSEVSDAGLSCTLANRDFGCACDTAADCASGVCVDDIGGKVCSKSCAYGCPVDWRCAVTAVSTACVPDWQCKLCSSDADCQVNGDTGSHCGLIGDGGFCLLACGLNGGCDADFTCAWVTTAGSTAPVKLCHPMTDACGCSKTWSAVGLTVACGSADGKCTGTRSCGFDGKGAPVLKPCDAKKEGPFYVDNDGDGYGGSAPLYDCAMDATNLTGLGGDCDDNDKNVFPGAWEYCNGKDDNCNGETDEFTQFLGYVDKDGDGYGIGAEVTVCSNGGQGFAPQVGDCNDANGAIHPGAAEICDGIDNNCNGEIDNDTCDDGDGCTKDSCAGASKLCVHIAKAATACDDGNQCTQDFCQSPGGACAHAIVAGTCALSGCTSGVCDATGSCQVTTFPDGTACDECGEQVCGAGVCTHWVWYAKNVGDPWLALGSGAILGTQPQGCGSFTSALLVDDAGTVSAGPEFSWATALSGGGAVVESWQGNSPGLVHISAKNVSTQATEPAFPMNYVNGAAMGANDGYLVFGACIELVPGTPIDAVYGCASLRNSDDSMAWAVMLSGAATPAQWAELDTATMAPSGGWLLGGRTRNATFDPPRTWLVWLDAAGKELAQSIGPAGDTNCAYTRLSPWDSGWIGEVQCSPAGQTSPPQFRQIGADGAILGPLPLPADLTAANVAVLPDGDLLLSDASFKPGSRFVRLAHNFERRWEIVLPVAKDLDSQAANTGRATAKNMLDLFLTGQFESCCDCDSWTWIDWFQPAPAVQRADAFGNTTCAATSGCAGKPMSDCDDKDPCTADGCYGGTCTHKTWPDGTPCPGGKCLSGQCGP